MVPAMFELVQNDLTLGAEEGDVWGGGGAFFAAIGVTVGYDLIIRSIVCTLWKRF